ncbi:MAG TPA: hypothetical protein VFG69_11150 [Nannocystaceae bacterium]|nr:hypothetical protein [Nannocystaceae bacterium]
MIGPERAVIAVALVTSACAGEAGSTSFGSGSGMDSTGEPAESSSTAPISTDESTTAPADSSGGTGNTPKLDVGGPAGTTGEQEFCNFVDLLFVIDNSLSMNEYQTQLALAWPTFVDEMWENLPPGTDLHVGMTTTSFYTGSCSEFEFNCETTASSSQIEDHYVTPDEGNTGTNGEQGRLFEWDGRTYFEAIVGDDAGELKTWFSQAAVAAGEDGCSYEMSSAAAGYAVHPANAAANAGFLRDEGAVLVIVVLTDEPDKSPEGAMTYYDMVLAAKEQCGGDQCVVITGLVDECIEGVDNQLWQFLNLFGNFQVQGSIEEPLAYAEVVGTALAQVIGQTCETIPPAG